MVRNRGILNTAVMTVGLMGTPLAGGLQQEAPAPLEEQETKGALPDEPVGRLRVVGQARTPEEWEAWQLVERATRLAEKAGLAESFLQNYPESGLTANAHYIIARNSYQLGDLENFTFHAEETLEELPDAPDLLAQLGFFYAENGQAAQAIDRANKALEVIDRVEKPVGVTASQWIDQVYQLKGEANYALGRAYLSRMSRTENRAEDPNLRKSIEYLQSALRYEPRHDYACFRLGFAERNSNNAGGALMAYAKAVAIGGVAAQHAQSQLEDVLSVVKESMPDSEWAEKSVQEVIDEASAELKKSVSVNQQERAQLVLELQQQLLQQQKPQGESSGDVPAVSDTPTGSLTEDWRPTGISVFGMS